MRRTEGGPILADEVDAVVLGAGISGLVATKILHNEGCRRVLVIDEYDRIGGNHIDCAIGGYTFDIGTLIFQDDSPLMRYFPELLELYHPITWRIARVAPGDVIREYPIAMREEVFGGGPIAVARLFASIAWGRLRLRPIGNAEEYGRYWIGARLFERSGLARYIERFSGVPARALDPGFCEKRMGWLAEAGSVSKVISRLMRRRSAGPGNRSFVRPRAGFAPLYAVARDALERNGARFALGERLAAITRRDGVFSVTTGQREVRCTRLISTIPVDRAYRLCGLGNEKLPYSTLVSLFFSFAGARGFDTSILYNFAAGGAWKRLTMFSDFFGPVDGREFLSVEVVMAATGVDPGPVAGAAFAADMAAKGLLVGSLKFEGSHVLDHAYPIYLHGAMARADGMAAALRRFGVESMGRQGRFDYLPTARQVTLAIEAAMQPAAA